VQIGQVWHMVNKLGDVTTWTVEQPPENSSCEVGPEVMLHITKNAARTYWMLGEPGVEDRWVLHRDPDGSVRSIQDTPHWSDGCALWGGSPTGPCYATSQWRPVPGLPLPNKIIPATMAINDNISIPTKYHLFSQWTQGSSYQCIAASENDKGLVDWVSGFYTTYVDTPVYKGIVMANDQYEANFTHEVWYFAPRIGLVQIDAHLVNKKGMPSAISLPIFHQLEEAYGGDVVTIKRID
jgi:hypothetical protein